MKRILSLLLCVAILSGSLCLLTACESSGKIALTSDNYSKYVAINVEIENFRKEGNKYYADITIETDRAANVEFEGAKLKEVKVIAESGSALAKLRAARTGANKGGLSINLNYLGESCTTFTYSSITNFSNNYRNIIDAYVSGWDAEGYVIISK